MALRRERRKDDTPACFTLLPDGKSRTGALLAAIVADFLLGALILAIPAGLPREIAPGTRFSALVLPAMPVVKKNLRPAAVRIPAPPVRTMTAPVAPAPRAKVEPTRVRAEKPPVLTPEFHAPAPVYPTIEQPRPAIHTGVLSASVAAPAPEQPPRKVQTGGFGDPVSVPETASAHRDVMVPTVGSFGSPMGPGSGNGTGGSRGVRGEIARAGFGDGVALPAQQDRGARRGESVHAGVFSDQTAIPAANAPAQHAEKPAIQPVEILEKPDPAYTAEARARKIEGNVVLEVIFAASGRVEVLRVVHSLGYGLDEEAIAAARRIRFRPERIDGKPVDARARLQIVFRLAY